MVATPCDFALSSTALPVPLSRLVIISTVAPLVIIWSAIVWNWFLSPWAFWMSNSTPAAWNASVRYLRSAVSHRAEDLLSGRMTPILPGFAGADAPPPPSCAEVVPESDPQAVRPRDSAATPAARVKILLRMGAGSFLPRAAPVGVAGVWSGVGGRPSGRPYGERRVAGLHRRDECCLRQRKPTAAVTPDPEGG